MNRQKRVNYALPLIALSILCQAAVAQQIIAAPNQPQGVYRAGEPIAWNIEVRGEGATQATEARYILKRNGYRVLREGVLPLKEGKGVFETTLTEPGTLLLELKAKLPAGEIGGAGGAVVRPEAITPSLPRPKDFDGFWKEKIAELQKTPLNAQLEPADSGKEGVEYYKIQMDNIRGSHIYGQLAKPRGGTKLPALLIVQWAGVYPLSKDWAVGRAQAGWLTLNIMAHDLPFDQPAKFYREAAEGRLRNYPAIGNEDRETSYFLRMYLSCYRAADYLTKRPDWDGRILVVTGGSQGGLQSVVTAALFPRITAVVANVPAGCDLTGPAAERAPGWPMWWWQTQGKDPEKVRQTACYFDVVNFASRVNCPTLIGLGLIDTVCPPSGIFAMTNQLKGRKELVIMPLADHSRPHDAFQARQEQWFASLARSGSIPVR
jgi:cephalosporin-C deacetylase-like acetyl esterase